MKMDEIAIRLNRVLDETIVGKMLSPYGRRAFFPRGIVAQSQEASGLAHHANATAGVALSRGHHLSHSMFASLSADVGIDRMVAYAPTAGDKELRQAWLEGMQQKNPSLAHAQVSLPVVTAGLTHALSVAADLFVGPEDTVIVPSPAWDNYEQIFAVRKGCTIVSPSLFDADLHFSIDDLERAIDGVSSQKIMVVLNFPNNPTGYTPTEGEMASLASMLMGKAATGKSLVVMVDDAYFGLFHDSSACRESLFTLLCDVHENLLAIKCDGATKEAMVWGFRIGFITFGAKGLYGEVLEALVQKTMGAIRSSVSSCSRIGQSLLLDAMRDSRYLEETEKVQRIMAERYAIVRQEINKRSGHPLLRPYPFNSGYFCTLSYGGDAEVLRRHLLDRYGIGTVSLGTHLLRIAYSAVDADLLPELMDTVYRGAEESWT
jgi:aspartate/methionine/tyrosine aminotransferase